MTSAFSGSQLMNFSACGKVPVSRHTHDTHDTHTEEGRGGRGESMYRSEQLFVAEALVAVIADLDRRRDGVVEGFVQTYIPGTAAPHAIFFL
jgi:hypothetical protein